MGRRHETATDPSQSLPRTFESKTKPPEGTSVWIGAYSGTSFESLCARNAISVIADPDELESIDEAHPHFYLSTVSIRHLVVHVCGRLPVARAGSRVGPTGPALRRIYPSTGSFQWPPGQPLTDEGLVGFVEPLTKPVLPGVSGGQAALPTVRV
jgi:hypothetical protein